MGDLLKGGLLWLLGVPLILSSSCLRPGFCEDVHRDLQEDQAMRDHDAKTVIERAKASGKSPLQAIREHLGLSREAVARIAKFDLKCLAACEEHAGVAMPD